ncbi:MAG: signal recognition particle-docking protein FtsY [Desulfuromusa sp.]|nr:signal recognition particle-docking protein FtsY [Desulfuromusa sp.]
MEWFRSLPWVDMVEWLNAVILSLSQLLASVGVPEEYRQLAAFAILYLGVTVVVLLFVLFLLKSFRRSKESDDGIAQAEEQKKQTEKHDAIEFEPAEESVLEPEPEEELEESLSLLERLKRGLSKTQSSLVGRVDSLLRSRTSIDEDLLEELEEILITADLGIKTTQQLIGSLESSQARSELISPSQVRQLLIDELRKILTFESKPLDVTSAAPFVIMVIGVNGVGKTTTIGKLANQFALDGKKVILGAGDTFRAAAAEQLQIWGERAEVEVISHTEGADPSAVAFDAAKAAVARKADILLLDTAGRLHTKVNLMEELKKIRRVLDREIPGAPHEVLLVLDATTGQNALTQAQLFNQAVPLDGIALTKLDGTAKGGIIIAIAAELQVPVRFVGIGEKIDDLRPFDAEMFISVLFDSE